MFATLQFRPKPASGPRVGNVVQRRCRLSRLQRFVLRANLAPLSPLLGPWQTTWTARLNDWMAALVRRREPGKFDLAGPDGKTLALGGNRGRLTPTERDAREGALEAARAEHASAKLAWRAHRDALKVAQGRRAAGVEAQEEPRIDRDPVPAFSLPDFLGGVYPQDEELHIETDSDLEQPSEVESLVG